VGEIDIKSLRKFQSHNISPNKPFKPVPTGFVMLENRKLGVTIIKIALNKKLLQFEIF
jgi:hypothetical protein